MPASIGKVGYAQHATCDSLEVLIAMFQACSFRLVCLVLVCLVLVSTSTVSAQEFDVEALQAKMLRTIEVVQPAVVAIAHIPIFNVGWRRPSGNRF